MHPKFAPLPIRYVLAVRIPSVPALVGWRTVSEYRGGPGPAMAEAQRYVAALEGKTVDAVVLQDGAPASRRVLFRTGAALPPENLVPAPLTPVEAEDLVRRVEQGERIRKNRKLSNDRSYRIRRQAGLGFVLVALAVAGATGIDHLVDARRNAEIESYAVLRAGGFELAMSDKDGSGYVTRWLVRPDRPMAYVAREYVGAVETSAGSSGSDPASSGSRLLSVAAALNGNTTVAR